MMTISVAQQASAGSMSASPGTFQTDSNTPEMVSSKNPSQVEEPLTATENPIDSAKTHTVLSNFHKHTNEADAIVEVRSISTLDGEPSEGQQPKSSTAKAIPQPTLKRATKWKNVAILLGFALTLLIFIATVAYIRYYDRKHTGFYVSTSTSMVAWKFGPTAVFTIFIALWRQVDYRTKLEAPWKQMLQGPNHAQRSVLLDYLSPMMPITFVRSLRNRHWEVAVAIGIFALLKLTVFFSTGLLTLQVSEMRTEYLNIALDLGNDTGVRSLMDNGSMSADSVAMSYTGAIQRNLDWPPRTSGQAAFQEISAAQKFPPNSSVVADVLAFYPWLDCEIANATFSFDPHETVVAKRDRRDDGFYTHASWSGPYIIADYQSEHSKGSIKLSHVSCSPMSSDTCDQNQILTSIQQIKTTRWSPSQGDEEDGIALLLFFLSATIDPSSVRANTSSSSGQELESVLHGDGWTQSVTWSSMLVCRSDYAIETGHTSSRTSGDGLLMGTSLSSPTTDNGLQLSNYTTSNLTNDVLQIASAAEAYVIPMNNNDAMSSSWFELMLYETGSHDLNDFRDPANMVEPANIVFKGLTSTWVGSWLSFPNHLTSSASITRTEYRLRVSQVSFWFMQLLMGIVVLLLCGLAGMQISHQMNTRHSFFQDVLILQRSEKFAQKINNMGKATDNELRESLLAERFTCSLSSENSMKIQTETAQNENVTQDHENPSSLKPSKLELWVPLSSKLWFAIATICSALIVIIILEVIQRTSKDGIRVSSDVSLGQDIAALLPALIMLSVSTMFGSADFTVASLTPYLALSRSTNLRELAQRPLGQLPPMALVSQIKLHHFGAFCVGVSALLGSILTIISSGLYSVQPLLGHRAVTAITTDTFDLSINMTGKVAGSRSYEFIERQNATFPAGTFDEIAYPSFHLDLSDPVLQFVNTTTSGLLEVDIPVLRASLNCSTVPSRSIEVSALNETHRWFFVARNYGFPPYANVSTVLKVPDQCLRDSVSSGSQEYSVTSSMYNTITEDTLSVVGEMRTITWPDPLDPAGTVSTASRYLPGCPSVAFTLGTYTIGQTSADTTSRLICFETVEEIPSTLTFNPNNLSLVASLPPRLRVNEAKTLDYSQNFGQLFPLSDRRLEALTDDSANTTVWPHIDLSSGGKFYADNFFRNLTSGKDGVPVLDLVGKGNEQKLRDAIQHTYRIFMAQVIGIDMREATVAKNPSISSSPTKVGTTLKAVLQDDSEKRVVQDPTLKLLLQITLGVMVVCYLCGFKTIKATSQILFHNPLTIAGNMSLIAGSQLVTEMKKKDHEEGSSKHVLPGDIMDAKLKLGWWSKGIEHEQQRNNGLLNDGDGEGEDGKELEQEEKRRHEEDRFGIDLVESRTFLDGTK